MKYLARMRQKQGKRKFKEIVYQIRQYLHPPLAMGGNRFSQD